MELIGVVSLWPGCIDSVSNLDELMEVTYLNLSVRLTIKSKTKRKKEKARRAMRSEAY
jgi:hypothetical protein